MNARAAPIVRLECPLALAHGELSSGLPAPGGATTVVYGTYAGPDEASNVAPAYARSARRPGDPCGAQVQVLHMATHAQTRPRPNTTQEIPAQVSPGRHYHAEADDIRPRQGPPGKNGRPPETTQAMGRGQTTFTEVAGPRTCDERRRNSRYETRHTLAVLADPVSLCVPVAQPFRPC